MEARATKRLGAVFELMGVMSGVHHGTAGIGCFDPRVIGVAAKIAAN